MKETRRKVAPDPKSRRSGLRITKVYTRTGDGGRTRLAGGQPVWKDSPRVEAYGTVDELNAAIGMVRALLKAHPVSGAGAEDMDRDLEWVQHKLFDLGGLLATAPGQSFPNMPRIGPADVTRLEQWMDACQRELPPLREFILPGGGILPSALHVARTVCRRAERRCVTLALSEAIEPHFVTFLNRLSDALFVLSRHAARLSGEAEIVWKRTSP